MNSTLAKFAILPTLFAAVHCASAQETGLVAKPIEYTLNVQPLDHVPFGLMRSSAPIGCGVTYLVSNGNMTANEDQQTLVGMFHDNIITGDGITAINGDSIVIDSITDNDGKNLALDDRGLTTWKFASSHVSRNGSCATFTIFVATEAPFTIPNIKGFVNATIMDKTQTQTQILTFKTDEKGQEQKAGPLSFSNYKNPYSEFSIQVKGNLQLVRKIEVNAGGKIIKQKGSSGSPGVTTYEFDSAPKTPEFTLSVTYYTDMKEVSVPFGQDATEGAAP